MGIEILPFVLVLLVVPPLWRLLTRAGLPPQFALLALMPGIGTLIVEAILAFSRWRAPEPARRSTGDS
jgi:hypothetical protein